MKNKIFITASILAMLFQCVPANVFAATSPTPVVTTSVVIKDENNDKVLEEYQLDTANTKEVVDKNGDIIYPMRRKTPCFSYGDIRRVHRIYASN